MSQQYIAKCVIQHNGRKIAPNTVINADEELIEAWLKKGFITPVGSPDAVTVSIRENSGPGPSAITETTKKADEDGEGEKSVIVHKYEFTDELLAGKSLDDLNAMIVEREPEGFEPYEELAEAKAHLQRDLKKD